MVILAISGINNSGSFSRGRIIWLSYVGLLLNMTCGLICIPNFCGSNSSWLCHFQPGAPPTAGLGFLSKVSKMKTQQTYTTTVHPNTSMQIIRLKRRCPLAHVLEECGKDFESLCKVGSHSEPCYTLWQAQNVLYLRKKCRTWCLIRWEVVGVWTGFMILGTKRNDNDPGFNNCEYMGGDRFKEMSEKGI